MIALSGRISLLSNRKAASPSLPYPEDLRAMIAKEDAIKALDLIKTWPGYEPTPLIALKDMASDIGIEALLYKDESKRFSLKSFKALGGAYAVAEVLRRAVEKETGHSPDYAALYKGTYREIAARTVVSCATDGNHGRSLAWGASLLGCPCVIYLHRDVSSGREQAIRDFGASIVRVNGNYDESVLAADKDAKALGRTVVSDTSYEGYKDIPGDVARGYTVMMKEIYDRSDVGILSHIFIQGGVGGLAAAVIGYLWDVWGASRPRVIIVEPERANCLQESARAGRRVKIEGDLDTIMAGLACGEVSLIAWEMLCAGANDFMTVSEEAIPETMKYLAGGYKGDLSVEAGESAVAGLAALILACQKESTRQTLGLTETSRVLILGTEGATDELLYQQLISGT